MRCAPTPPAGDDIFQPFEPELDWSRFAVQPTESQIPTLHQLLADIGDEQVAQMQVCMGGGQVGECGTGR